MGQNSRDMTSICHINPQIYELNLEYSGEVKFFGRRISVLYILVAMIAVYMCPSFVGVTSTIRLLIVKNPFRM
ncbi:hypothetical protein D8674_032651 [Pyrus ussuriensis x Pyrus communis]|uniref:Uncharacterized protein n=1 Tax=Pyrus ussuriensis x Pyrus communis TaxID=2448454 RepID=A0A5N5HIP2_9ROSA|nr:hypothetical protein D8674_032651 [Pyrus ussuriensis x Pyrus communis]